MKTQIKRFLLTLGFMTRIPVNVDLGEVKDEDMHKGFLYYPVVGLILGLCDMAVFLLVSLILPEVFGILFAMLANLCLTGAFHLDGLSDTADGIYSARTRERMLEIMKDSRIGTNGAVAMCFDLALKFAGIYYSDIRWLMILLMPIAGKMVQGEISAPVVLGRDHHDVSGTDSPYRETSNIYDGSKFTADMAVQNVIGDSFRGATWVSLHNGGGVGWGEVINGGFGMLLDGSADADRRLKNMLFWDVNNGISRRSWARNEGAVFAIKRAMEANPNLKVTLPNYADDQLVESLF